MGIPPGVKDGSPECREWERRHPKEIAEARSNPGEMVVCPPWYSRRRRLLRWLGHRLFGFCAWPSRGEYNIHFEKGYLHAYPTLHFKCC